MSASSSEPISSAMGPLVLGSRDPEELSTQVAAFVPGVRHVATSGSFRNKMVAGLLHGTALFSYVARAGGARFSAPRPYYSISFPLASAFEAGPRFRRRPVAPGAFCIDDPREEAWLWNLDGGHVLGLGVDAARLEAYRDDSDRGPFVEPQTLVSTATPEGRRLLDVLVHVRHELVRPGSVCPTPLAERELEDELILLVALACVPERTDRRRLGDQAARRAEEILATALSRPVSLLEAARQAETTPRTLSRTIRRRHGVGPMAFRRRRRLEAAHRDLLWGEAEETSVTEVALRYGFNHLGRFGAQYRRIFGEPPSETLHR